MNINEKKELINKLVARVEAIGFQNFLQSKHKDGNLVPDIYECFRQVMGRHYKIGCKACFTDCFIELRAMLKNDTLMKIEEKEYRLKKGAVLSGFAFKVQNIDCTDDNLTTELAEKHLKLDPSRIIFFSKYPVDWKSRAGIKDEVVNETKPIEPITSENAIIQIDKLSRNDLFAKLKTMKIKTGATMTTEELQVLYDQNKK
jgi:hypothetical protein